MPLPNFILGTKGYILVFMLRITLSWPQVTPTLSASPIPLPLSGQLSLGM